MSNTATSDLKSIVRKDALMRRDAIPAAERVRAAEAIAARAFPLAIRPGMTALVPPFAAMLGIPLLGEWPGLPTIVAIILTTVGVALAAGAFDGWRRTHSRGNLTA